jgi:hypothetical protein
MNGLNWGFYSKFKTLLLQRFRKKQFVEPLTHRHGR